MTVPPELVCPGCLGALRLLDDHQPRAGVRCERCDHVGRPLLEQPEQEDVRMKDLDGMWRSGLVGEVLQVEGD